MSTKIKSISIAGMTVTLFAEGNTYRVTTILEGFETTRKFLDYAEASKYFEGSALGN